MAERNGADALVREVRAAAHELADGRALDTLIRRLGAARYVLLGEASHGTSEFYTWRARLSQRLIQEHGFSFIAVEGDWPDGYRVNRYVKGYSEAGASALEVLGAYQRWPTWMWANWEIVALVEWLRQYNAETKGPKAGFYGLDVYSLWESLESILGYLEATHSEAVEAARQAFLCFEPYREDAQTYAWHTALVPDGCEDEAIGLLMKLRGNVPGAPDDDEARFSTEQNARTLVNAERHYRTMLRGEASSWNLRDRHMMETLDHLMAHHGPQAKAIVWAHNTHIGDARATDMAAAGMLNLGQLVREQHGEEGVALVGFGSYRGHVIAGAAWGAPMERMAVPPAQEASWEDILHRADVGDHWLWLDGVRRSPVFLRERGHRAIGVVYNPRREQGNYVPTVLPQRYNAFLYMGDTEALHPLQVPMLDAEGGAERPPETYPWGV